MSKKIFPHVSIMNYVPGEPGAEITLHICKGGNSGMMLDQLFSRMAQRTMKFTCAWDDGSGRSIEPLEMVFKKSKDVYVAADFNPHGIKALYNVSKLLNRIKVPWRFLGIDDDWLGVVPEDEREAWFKSRCIPLRTDARFVKLIRKEIAAVGGLYGKRCSTLLDAGLSIELEAFCSNPWYRPALRKIMKAKRKPVG